MNSPNANSDDQQTLAQETLQVIKDTQSLEQRLSGEEGEPRFAVTETEVSGRPVFFVEAGKNCFFEVDKGVLESLQVGTLSDVKNSAGQVVPKEHIISHLGLSISCARSNIDQTLRHME